MAITTEIWVEDILGAFRRPTSFLNHCVDHSAFIDNSVVHVPNAGAASGVVKNGKKFPAEISSREDIDLTYKTNTYRLKPILLQNAEAVELSYDKRKSIINENSAALYEAVAFDILRSWCDGVKTPINKAGGTMKGWLKSIATKMGKDGVPMEDRYVMLSATQYYSFLESLSSSEALSFSATADVAKGELGRFLGFTFKTEFIPENFEVEVFAWQEGCVSKAIGAIKLYDNEGDATYYGDLLSGEMRAAGKAIRQDQKGVALVGALAEGSALKGDE